MSDRADYSNAPLNLLALDGGGIRGLSELLILDEIMKRIQFDLKLEQAVRPCDYFHLIGGTSTGGLIAILLGRFRMTTGQAIQIYDEVAEAIFSNKNKKPSHKDGTFKATTLENKVKEVAARNNITGRLLERDPERDTAKAFVCAMPAINMAHPRRFRTYQVRENASFDCEIWEAARATTAAPTFFKRIAIGEGNAKEEFVDGGLRCNNPVNEVLEEAIQVFGHERKVNCLISIGTGHPGVIGLEKPDTFQNILPLKLIDALKEIATDCETRSHELSSRFRNVADLYFRFNVNHGLGGISLEEWKKLSDVRTHTNAYLQDTNTSTTVDKVVKLLVKSREEGYSLASIVFPNSLPIQQTTVQIKSKADPSPKFTGRVDHLRKLKEALLGTQLEGRTLRKRYLLYGMGGVGKTQIASKFADENFDRFTDIFWIDGSSETTIAQSYKNIAAEKVENLPDAEITDSHGLKWLNTSAKDWLLLFDNVDDQQVFTKAKLPETHRGNIIFTSRDQELQHSFPTEMSQEVLEMEPDEALGLLLKWRDSADSTAKREDLAAIARELGHLPLAIDQAGAYMAVYQCVPQDYMHTINERRADLMSRLAYERISSHDRAVYTTFEISYTALESSCQDARNDKTKQQAARDALLLLGIFAMLHREGIPRLLFKLAAISKNLPSWKDYTSKMSLEEQDLTKEVFGLLDLGKDSPVRGSWNSHSFDEAVRQLTKLSLVRVRDSGKSYSMHPLVHSWACDRMNPEIRTIYRSTAIGLIACSIRPGHEKRDYTWRQTLLPHALKCHLEFSVTENWKVTVFVSLIELFARAGAWQKVGDFMRSALEASERSLGENHIRTLEVKRQLAGIYYIVDKPKEAEELLAGVPTDCGNVTKEDDDDQADTRITQACLYIQQNQLGLAEELLISLTAANLEKYGKEHMKKFESMELLAIVYLQQGRVDKAEELIVPLLDFCANVYGQDTPESLTVVSLVATIRWEQGKVAEAIELIESCVEASEIILGKDHPETIARRLILEKWTASLQQN